ncbi:hypothetical protein EJ02DRAFT_421176 [Clathrospora elynae]|uniref:Uncharacterized protein n=1 Tax=Clathrospora elynae TaxID=706981 RepID=A0A6A5SYB7_9PLEO|nr:hypothetical protein EJ02DRAFT_421176 [Clathrospora elynae]
MARLLQSAVLNICKANLALTATSITHTALTSPIKTALLGQLASGNAHTTDVDPAGKLKRAQEDDKKAVWYAEWVSAHQRLNTFS